MSTLPPWWINASGVFFILGSVALIALLILVCVLISVSLDLVKQLKALTSKVEELTTKANGIADQVQSLTTDVSVRTKGIVSVVDENAHRAFGIVEKAAPVLVAVGLVLRLASLIPGRRRKKR